MPPLLIDIARLCAYNLTVQSVTYAVSGLPESGQKGVPVEAEPQDYGKVIDQALQLVYAQHHRLTQQLYADRSACPDLTLDELRRSQFGQDLDRLAKLARGETRAKKEQVLSAIESVVELLFWPVAAADYSVPRSFWDTALGKMLALAKFRAFEPHELVSIGTAAQQLNVTRPTIYRWMDERALNYVRDDMSGRTYVVRHDIELRKRVPQETQASVAEASL